MNKIKLSKKERNAINTLKRLADRWPETLWLFSASGNLCVMKKDQVEEGGDFVKMFRGEAVDQNYSVDRIRIENDGGDF